MVHRVDSKDLKDLPRPTSRSSLQSTVFSKVISSDGEVNGLENPESFKVSILPIYTTSFRIPV